MTGNWRASLAARARAVAMDTARFDLGEVCEQAGQKLVRTTYQLARVGQEVDVRDMLETEGGLVPTIVTDPLTKNCQLNLDSCVRSVLDSTRLRLGSARSLRSRRLRFATLRS
jgi:hypothetical protein